jgi:hypothetical protein
MDDDGYVVYVAQANSKLLDLLLLSAERNWVNIIIPELLIKLII